MAVIEENGAFGLRPDGYLPDPHEDVEVEILGIGKCVIGIRGSRMTIAEHVGFAYSYHMRQTLTRKFRLIEWNEQARKLKVRLLE